MKVKYTLKSKGAESRYKMKVGDSVILELSNVNTTPANGQLKAAIEEKFGVTPVPDDSYEVEFVYWSTPTDMVAYNESCIIPSRFDHVILEGALMAMMRFRSNEQGAVAHQNNFDKNLKAMRRVLLDEAPTLRSTVINRFSVHAR